MLSSSPPVRLSNIIGVLVKAYFTFTSLPVPRPAAGTSGEPYQTAHRSRGASRLLK